jgi:cytochrome c peroxidase
LGTFLYADADVMLPAHFTSPDAPFGSVAARDNTPATHPITNAGATLGRVLFHDRRLSVNDAVACASCHVQSNGFADVRRLSRGFAGGLTKRHSMGLANARYYVNGRAFWDERAMSLEVQALLPIQDPVEIGVTAPRRSSPTGLGTTGWMHPRQPIRVRATAASRRPRSETSR